MIVCTHYRKSLEENKKTHKAAGHVNSIPNKETEKRVQIIGSTDEIFGSNTAVYYGKTVLSIFLYNASSIDLRSLS